VPFACRVQFTFFLNLLFLWLFMRIVLAGLGCSSLTLIALLSVTQGAIAQVTGAGETIVSPIGNRFEIVNGTVAGDNLFHSFQQFSLTSDQSAVFERLPPNVNHIFAQVIGGNVSNIDGAISIAGGNAPNLYFMNPAGIVFGPNSILNLRGAFVGTTASGIDFGNGIFDRNNLEARWTGLPQRLLFSPGEPGVIVNLAKTPMQVQNNLALIAGSVHSPSKLEVPGGAVTVMTTNGNTAVRIGVEGNLLSFDVAPDRLNGAALPFTSPTLPELITGNTAQPGQIYLDDVSVRSDCPNCPTRITVKSRDAIQTSDLVTGSSGETVLAANGNIIVESIYTGDGGLSAQASGTIQVTGQVKITDSAILETPNPVSIRSGIPIDLRYNGATTSGQQSGGIQANGNGKFFIVGPTPTGQLQTLAANESGTGGAILIQRFNGSTGGFSAIFQSQVFGAEPAQVRETIVVSDNIIGSSDLLSSSTAARSNSARSNAPSNSSQGSTIPIANRDCRNRPQTRTSTQLIAQRSATESSIETTDSCGTSEPEEDAILTILEDELKTAIPESTISP
jgi:filamentous hemagglutinin family protein